MVVGGLRAVVCLQLLHLGFQLLHQLGVLAVTAASTAAVVAAVLALAFPLALTRGGFELVDLGWEVGEWGEWGEVTRGGSPGGAVAVA